MTDPASKKEVPLRVIDLATSSKGYQFVLKEFNKTMTQGKNYTAIVKIQRIQNPALYGQYASMKKSLDLHNQSSVQNERWLFHGTKESVISHINQTNFNRSLSGQNGMHYIILLCIAQLPHIVQARCMAMVATSLVMPPTPMDMPHQMHKDRNICTLYVC